MPQIRGRLLGLCLPAVLLACLDGGLTLAGQSKEYWAGDYARVNEVSPTFHHLLAYHPLAFAGGFAVWMLLFTGLILLLPQTLALTAALAITLGHAYGASTWLMRRFHYPYQAVSGLYLLTAFALAVGIRRGWRAVPQSDHSAGARLPWAVRWLVISALFALTVYLFLWPRKV